MCKRMVIADIELLQVCSVLMRRDGLKSAGLVCRIELLSLFIWRCIWKLSARGGEWMLIPEMGFSYHLIITWCYFFGHDFRVVLSCYIELHLSLLLHADPFQLVLSTIIISLSYIDAMDIQYPHWHISGTSIDYQVLKVGTVRTRVECKCIMSYSIVLMILNVQSILIKHWLQLIYVCDF